MLVTPGGGLNKRKDRSNTSTSYMRINRRETGKKGVLCRLLDFFKGKFSVIQPRRKTGREREESGAKLGHKGTHSKKTRKIIRIGLTANFGNQRGRRVRGGKRCIEVRMIGQAHLKNISSKKRVGERALKREKENYWQIWLGGETT